MKLGTALKLGRVSNLPTVWTNVLAGLVLAGAAPTPAAPVQQLVQQVVPLGLMASLLYVGGMFLNDAFDADIDARERPERPIPSGEVTRAAVLGWGFALLAAGILVALFVSWWAALGALCTAALIVVYDRHHKGVALAPVLMGLCRVGLYLTAALSVGPQLPAPVLLGALLLLGYVLGLTYAAARENSSALVRTGPLLGLWGPAVVARGLLLGPLAGKALLLGFAAWLWRALGLVRTREPKLIRSGIVSLIAGIALVDGLLIAHAGALELVPLAVLGFGATLALQRLVSGT